jgi:hypothetical protein
MGMPKSKTTTTRMPPSFSSSTMRRKGFQEAREAQGHRWLPAAALALRGKKQRPRLPPPQRKSPSSLLQPSTKTTMMTLPQLASRRRKRELRPPFVKRLRLPFVVALAAAQKQLAAAAAVAVSA